VVRVKPHHVGDIVPVRSVPGGYPLPEGLPEGAMVRVIAFDHAYRRVEWEGREFRVYVMNLDRGLDPPRLPPNGRQDSDQRGVDRPPQASLFLGVCHQDLIAGELGDLTKMFHCHSNEWTTSTTYPRHRLRNPQKMGKWCASL
jgi:hypothetical protein